MSQHYYQAQGHGKVKVRSGEGVKVKVLKVFGQELDIALIYSKLVLILFDTLLLKELVRSPEPNVIGFGKDGNLVPE